MPEEQQRQLFEAAQQSEEPEIGGVVNLYSNVLAYSYPKDWVPVYQVRSPQLFMMEFIPYGEDVRTNWTQMLTIQAIPQQVASRIELSQFINGMASSTRAGCAGQSTFDNLGAIDIGGITAHRVTFACTDAESTEATILQATKRQGDLIIAIYAMRSTPDENGEPLMTETEQAYFISLLDRMRLSDATGAQAN